MDAARVTSKGQVTIPKAVRQRLGIREGSRVAFDVKGERVELRVLVVHGAEQNRRIFGMLRSKRSPVPADFDPASLLRPGRK
ncbi:MAG: AbrB/MazE/SpoVT family DNA-binding domain-containing protein [Casimicrobiaceae bacterium]